LNRLPSNTLFAPWLSRVGIILAWFAALTIALAIMVPFDPVMPAAGLDSSWALAMNQALAQHLSFGDQLSFTYGPWASICTQYYNPATDHLMLFGGAYLALSLWIALGVLIDRRTWPWMIVLFAVVIPLRSVRDVVVFLPPVAAAIAAVRFGADGGDTESGPGYRVVLLAVLFAPLGFVPLIKGSAVVLSLGVAACASGLFLARRRIWFAVTVLSAPAVSALAFWLIAGQSPGTLVAYLSQTLRLSSAYADAMSLDGNPTQIRIYLAGAIVLLIAILVSRTLERRTKLYLMGVYGVFLFIAFKAGFIRHDTHAFIASTSLLLGAFMLPFAGRSGTFAVAMCGALVASPSIERQFYPGGMVELVKSRSAVLYASLYSSPKLALRARLGGDAQLRRQYAAALALIARQYPLPKLAGSTDIYPHDQAFLFASSNTWSPRPTFQSYAAYTPELLEGNRQHLLGPEAPDNIIFRVDPPGWRLPSTEDGASWPALLRRYQPTGADQYFVFLRSRETVSSAPETSVPQVSVHRLGESVRVPSSGNPILATIDVRPTLFGQIAGFFLKRSQLGITIELSDHTNRAFRLISGTAAAGFVLSPLVETTSEFRHLYGADPELMRRNQVKSFVIASGDNSGQWSRSYEVTFRDLAIDVPDDLEPVFGVDKLQNEVPGYTLDLSQQCTGSIDHINELPPAAGFQIQKSFRVDGWIAASLKQGKVGDSVYIILSDGQHRRFAKAKMVPRPDVSAFFRSPGLDRSGFGAAVDVSTVQGKHTLGLAITLGNRLLVCSQPSVPVNIQ
jgi:hypothetical protein